MDDVKWNVDRSSPTDKIADFVERAEFVKPF